MGVTGKHDYLVAALSVLLYSDASVVTVIVYTHSALALDINKCATFKCL